VSRAGDTAIDERRQGCVVPARAVRGVSGGRRKERGWINWENGRQAIESRRRCSFLCGYYVRLFRIQVVKVVRRRYATSSASSTSSIPSLIVLCIPK